MRSILIVARTARWRKALSARLEQEGYQVTNVDSVEQALAILAGPLPGALLLDSSVRRKDARRLNAVLDQEPGLQTIRRLFAMGSVDTARAPQSGPVFHKPFDPEHVVRALRALYPDPERATPAGGPRSLDLDLMIQAAMG
jgi:DNA-binding response OmpR family regulator